ncbi:MAG TPA: DUF3060 domain-containing protein [Kofleriaceae bacterium]|nr:DUF3060 domain-containing protein [Kofleriaceae bacterium]
MKQLVLAFVFASIPAGSALAEKSFTGDTGATWDCANDAEVSISSSKATFTITGACESITVSGDALTLTIDNVKEIVVNGHKNKATIGTLGEVTINGNNNTVIYKKPATGKKPGVQNNGTKNSVAKSKTK